MKHSKHLKFLFTALLLLCCSAAGAYDIQTNYYSFTITGDKTVRLDYSTATGDMTIPSTVTSGGVTYTVTSIGSGSRIFGSSSTTGYKVTRNIVIPSTVTSIGGSAFRSCSGIKSVVIPNSVTSIGDYAFEGCTGLTSIEIPNSVTSIGVRAFYDCTGLTSVVIPNSVKSIGAYAFRDCSAIEYLNLANVETIGDYAFQNCSGLDFVLIPESVKTIGGSAFSGCGLGTEEVHNFSSVSPGISCTNFKKVAGQDFIFETVDGVRTLRRYTGNGKNIVLPEDEDYVIGAYAFACAGELDNVTIPNTVTSIGDYTFAYSTIKSLIIPPSMLTISSSAFKGTTIRKTTFLGNTKPTGAEYAKGTVNYVSSSSVYGFGTEYKNLSSAFTLNGVKYVPTSMVSGNLTCDVIDCSYDATAATIAVDSVVLYKGLSVTVKYINPYSFYKNDFIKSISVNNDGNVGIYAFYGCNGVDSKATVKNNGNVNNYAFYGSTITGVELSNAGAVGSYAFANSPALQTADVNNAGAVGNYAFANCPALQTVKASNKGNIGSYAFTNCPVLQTANISNGGNVGSYAFQNSFIANGGEVNISNTGYVGDYAFQGCTGLQIANISNTGYIGSYAFQGCSSLKNADIRNGEYIGNYAFAECSGLTTVDINIGEYIGDNAFENSFTTNTSAGQVTINSVGRIGNSAFKGCKNLYNVTLGSEVTDILDSAFYGCSKLQKILIPDNVQSVGKSCFRECYAMQKAEIGTGVKRINESTFHTCSALVDVKIGENVAAIGNSAFEGCSSLPVITIPEATGSIYDYVFNGCSKLKNVYIKDREGSISLGSNGTLALFSSCPLDSVYIGAKLSYRKTEKYGFSPFHSNKSLRSVAYNNIDDSIHAREYAFCTNLKKIKFSEKMKVIGDSAFYRCTALPGIKVPDYVTLMGEYSFALCSSLKKADVGTGVTKIHQSTFRNCTSLVDMTIGKNVTDIENAVFAGCTSLPAIKIPQSTVTIKDSVFYNCSKLATFVIEDRTKTLTMGSNGYSDNATTVTQYPLFSTCPLDSVYIGGPIAYNTTKAYGYSPFYFNSSLRTIYVNTTDVPEYLCYECRKLQTATFSDVALTIGNWAFSSCFTLNKLTLGKNLKTIGTEAFSDCTGVTEFYSYNEVPPTCGTSALSDIDKWSCTLYVPANSMSVYQAANQWKEFLFVDSAEQSYTVTFVIDDEVYATYEVVEGCEITLPETPVREGYLFSGWSEIPAVMPAEDVTITGSFINNTFTVTYFVDGVAYSTGSAVAGSEIAMPDAPAKDGYAFVGWARETPVAIDIASNADAMLYTNAPCTNTQYGDQFVGWHVLFDGRSDTFFHSEYSDVESTDGLDHYIRVDMGENSSVSLFTFTYTNRSSNSVYYSPKKIVVEGSNSPDGDYEEIAVLSNLSAEDSYVYNSPVIGGNTAYRYIRYRVVETQYNGKVYNHPYFHIGEFGMANAAAPALMPSEEVVLTAVYKKIDNSFTADGFCYRITDKAACTVEVTHDNGDALYAGNVTIPASVTYNGVTYSVTGIGENAFYACTGLRSVTIPESVVAVGDGAFAGCTSLANITAWGETPAAVGENAFGDISGASVLLCVPAGAMAAYEAAEGWGVLSNIVEMNNVTLPLLMDGENGLPGEAVGDNIVWESGMLFFESEQNGIRITTVETNTGDLYNGFPMVALGELEFYNVLGERISYTVTTNSLESTEGSLDALYDDSYSTYYHSTWSNGTTPNSYVYLDVVFSEPVEALMVVMVSRNERLVPTKIGITSTGVQCDIAPDETCGENATWALADGVLTISGEGAVTSMPWAVFANEVTSVVIEDGITSMPGEAFLRFANLGSATLPSSLTAISDGMFSRTGLESIEIPEGVTSLGTWAFDNCPALTTVTLPSTITDINNYAFENCVSLESITVASETPATVGANVFAGISSTATLYVPKGAKAAYEAADGWNTIPNIVELVNTRLITYMVDGEVYATEEVEVGAGIEPVAAPEKELYAFVEWNGLPNVMPDEDIVVEAEYEQVAVKITIGAHGSTTYCSQYALDFSEVEGLKAYAATGFNINTGIITMTRVMTTVEGTGIFFKATSGTYIVPIIETSGDYSLNMLAGVLNKTLVKDVSEDGLYANYRYVRPTGETEYMFYRSTATGANVSAGKAYLQIPLAWLGETASKTIGVRFEEGELTDIDEVTDANVDETIVYDLNGRRIVDVESLEKGIYIINGKKTLVK